MKPRTRALACLVAVCVSSGCVQIRVDFQTLPSATVFQDIEVGVTTRAELLEKLGPPEEFRQPAMGEQARRLDRREQRALEEKEVFQHSSWTWASERRSADTFWILVFQMTKSRSFQEQWWIEFDEADVVRLLTHTDEIGEP